MTAQPQSANARTKKNASSRPRGYFKYLQPCFWGSEGLWSTWDWDLKWKGHRSMKVAIFIRTAAGKGWKPRCCEHIFSDLLPSHKSVPPCFTRHLHLGWHSGKKLPPIKELKAFQCCLTCLIYYLKWNISTLPVFPTAGQFHWASLKLSGHPVQWQPWRTHRVILPVHWNY